MFGLGTTELIVIGIIVLLIFGAKRIPEIGKGLGGALREFRNIKNEFKGADKGKEKKKEISLEEKVNEKVLEHLPGAKKAMDIKEKVEKIKDLKK